MNSQIICRSKQNGYMVMYYHMPDFRWSIDVNEVKNTHFN
jgi:hypothetical protein